MVKATKRNYKRCHFQKSTALRCQSWRGLCSQLLKCNCQEAPAQPVIRFNSRLHENIGQARFHCDSRRFSAGGLSLQDFVRLALFLQEVEHVFKARLSYLKRVPQYTRLRGT